MPATAWREGDIAYLTGHDHLNDRDYRELISSSTIHPGATGHPCIILKVLPGARVVITTVSAYGSGDHNGNLAPWLAKQCYSEQKQFFRSFDGSVVSSPKFRPLRLIPGQTMPKPKSSWLLINRVYNVPVSAIGWFTAPGKKILLKMTPDSLARLRSDIVRCPSYDTKWQLVETPSRNKGSPTATTQGLPRALPEAAAAISASNKRPTANNVAPTTPAKQIQAICQTAAALPRPRITLAPCSSAQGTAQIARPKPISWAAVASRPVAPRHTMSTLDRAEMVKAAA